MKVGYIADGIDINNPDFIRADGTHVFVDYQDFTGEAPNAPTGAAEAFGDASSIAAQGRQVYDIVELRQPAHPLPAGCNITRPRHGSRREPRRPEGLRQLRPAPTSRFIQAIDYAVTSTSVDVLNESFGGNPYPGHRATTRSRSPTTPPSRPA